VPSKFTVSIDSLSRSPSADPDFKIEAPLPKLSTRLKIIYASDLPSKEKAVLAYIAFRVDKDSGSTYVGLKRMAKETGLPRSTLKVRLKNLQRLGRIERHQRWNKTSITVLIREMFHFPRGASTEPCPGPAIVIPCHQQQAPPQASPNPPGADSKPVSVSLSGTLSTSTEIISVASHKSEVALTDFQKLFSEIKKTTPDLTQAQFDWMISRIRGRAKSAPKYQAYYAKSAKAFLADIEVELTDFLFTAAQALLREGCTDGDVRERLKYLCAENDLPMTPDLIAGVLERAYRKS
jgi:hypothetical protein